MACVSIDQNGGNRRWLVFGFSSCGTMTLARVRKKGMEHRTMTLARGMNDMS